jgi:hypothetical protein
VSLISTLASLRESIRGQNRRKIGVAIRKNAEKSATSGQMSDILADFGEFWRDFEGLQGPPKVAAGLECLPAEVGKGLEALPEAVFAALPGARTEPVF